MFKPMLAPNEIPDEALLASRLPYLASYKLDGIRCMIQDGRLKSRTLKDIPNESLQQHFGGLKTGIDGELVQGVKQDNETFKRSHSIVMSNKPLDFYGDTVRLHVFDKFSGELGFRDRLINAAQTIDAPKEFGMDVVMVPHVMIHTMEDLAGFERQALENGYEGVMLRSPDGPYKQGRATLNQGWLMKLKRYVDAEARVLSCYEEMENQNEEFTNELGRTARSSAKDGKVGKGQLGGFNVVGVNGAYKDVEFRVSSSSIKHDIRQEMWDARLTIVGDTLTYKYFPIGSDEKPRAPVFKGFRSVEDIG